MQLIIRAKFTKNNKLRYISHLDLMRLFQRAFRRADIPIKYSEGFNPHPKFSVASALTLGISSEGEYMDIELEKEMPIRNFIDDMNNVLPEDIKILECKYVEDTGSISSQIAWGFYKIGYSLTKDMDINTLKGKINDFMQLEQIVILKEKKKKGKIVEKEENIKEKIGNINVKEVKDRNVVMEVLLRTGDNDNLKPINFIQALKKYTNIDIIEESININRIELFIEKDNQIVRPL